MSTVEVRELSVRAASAWLRRAELYLAPGEVVAVAGDAGGSVLVRTLAGVLVPASGAVRVGGEELAALSVADVAARRVVLVPAGWRAFGTLTVRESVLVGAGGDGAAADAVLARVGLPAAAPAAALPAAQARMLAVAVALARRPRLLLVDGLSAVAGVAGTRVVLAAVRAAGVTAVVAERTAGTGRGGGAPARATDPADAGGGAGGAGADAPRTFEPRAYDRVFVTRGGVLRPWRPV